MVEDELKETSECMRRPKCNGCPNYLKCFPEQDKKITVEEIDEIIAESRS